MRKNFFFKHTSRVCGKNIHPKGRHETFGQPKLSFGKRPAEIVMSKVKTLKRK